MTLAGERRERELAIIAMMQSCFRSAEDACGFSDDAAVLHLPKTPGARLVVTVDAQTSGKDFILGDDPFLVGRYSAAASASDLAAMGAQPRYLLVDLLFPFSTNDSYFRRMAQGIEALAGSCGATVVGGDTEDSADFARVSITSIGYCEGWRPLMRAGASPGDAICLVGHAGRPLAECVMNGKIITSAFLNDVGYAHIGSLLGKSGLVNAAMDTSDGIYVTLETMCRAVGLGCMVDAAQVPLAPNAKAAVESGLVSVEQVVRSNLSDHLLILAVSKSGLAELSSVCAAAGVPMTNIGSFGECSEVCISSQGELMYARDVQPVDLL